MDKQKNYIIPHTHWDREWRYPIWGTRKLLIEFMDMLLDILDADPDYRYFLMDGQVSPIEDYLEICPEQRDRMIRHLQKGRIGIGPWYTLPDLYPLDGESLLRNLNEGIRICKKYGGHLNVGYNSFGWGQTAQFPQIYADYGFDTIICAKKVSEERAPYAEFMWESPDGTRVLTSRLGQFARANFFFHAYINSRYGLKFLSEEFRYSPEKAGFAMHRADAVSANQDYFLIDPVKGHDFSYLKQGLEETFEANSNTLCKQSQLLLSGCDFSTPQPDLSEVIKEAEKAFPDMDFINAPLTEYTDDLHAALDNQTLPLVKGELRDGPACDCSGNALASRMYLKILNKRAQTKLLGYAEPFCTMAAVYGAAYPKHFLDKAWKYMLDSHSHDAINGVTQDKTADDVEYRLNQAVELAQVAYDLAAEYILKKINLDSEDKNASFICVFNPLPFPNQSIVRVVLDTPKDATAWSVRVLDESGCEMELQENGRSEISCPVHDLGGRPWPFYADRHDVFLDSGVIPALGYRVFKVLTQAQYTPKHHYWYPMRKTKNEDICKTPNVLENEFLKVFIQPNGTFDLRDKATEQTYFGMNYFEDTGDVGSYWAYYPPYKNKTFNTLTSCPKVWLEENGPLSATIAVEHHLELPSFGEEPLYGYQGKSERSTETKEMRIMSRITLTKLSRYVAIKTEVGNNVQNHRLSVGFPTHIVSDVVCASGHFTVDKRGIIPTKDTEGMHWNEMQTQPMQDFVDISDGENGLALISNSCCEYEALTDDARTLKLTLFRAVQNMIVTGWECVNRYPQQEGSQLQRTMIFEYAVFPHFGDSVEGHVLREAKRFAEQPMPYQVTGAHSGSMPLSLGFMEIEHHQLVLSALKKADNGNGYILRSYNPTDETIVSRVRFARQIKSARLAKMDEKPISGLPLVQNGDLEITVAHHKIVTLLLEFSDETK